MGAIKSPRGPERLESLSVTFERSGSSMCEKSNQFLRIQEVRKAGEAQEVI